MVGDIGDKSASGVSVHDSIVFCRKRSKIAGVVQTCLPSDKTPYAPSVFSPVLPLPFIFLTGFESRMFKRMCSSPILAVSIVYRALGLP